MLRRITIMTLPLAIACSGELVPVGGNNNITPDATVVVIDATEEDGDAGDADAADEPTWTTASAAFVGRGCVVTNCHGGGANGGNYSLSTYNDALGNGVDSTPNIIPGNASSATLVYLPAAKNHFGGPLIEDEITEWVVTYEAQE